MWPFKKTPEVEQRSIPLCEDCKFYLKSCGGSSFDHCLHPKANPHRPIRREEGDYAFCDHQRRWSGHCEYSGRWFEPKV